MPDVDEFGIPIRKSVPKNDTDEFGIPIRKQTSVLPTLSQQSPNLGIQPVGTFKPKNIKEAVAKDHEDNDSYAGAIWNKIVESGERLAGGAVRAAFNLNTRMQPGVMGQVRHQIAEQIDQERISQGKPRIEIGLAERAKNAVATARSKSSSRVSEAKIAEGFGSGSLKKNLKALPVMAAGMLADIGGAVASGGSSFALQGYEDALNEVDKIPEAQGMGEGTRQAFGVAGGIVNGVLEKVGLDKILKNSGATRFITAKVTKEVTEELANKGIKATAEQFEKMVLKKANSAANRVLNTVAHAGKAGAIEGLTEGGQEFLMDASRLAINAAENHDIFDEDEMKQTAAKRYLTSLAAGGILGGIGGGVAGMANTHGHISEKIDQAKTQEEVASVMKEVDDHIADGTLDKEDAEEMKPVIEQQVKEKMEQLNGPAVIMPDEINHPQEITIGPKEIPVDEKQGAAILLPQNNNEPNIVQPVRDEPGLLLKKDELEKIRKNPNADKEDYLSWEKARMKLAEDIFHVDEGVSMSENQQKIESKLNNEYNVIRGIIGDKAISDNYIEAIQSKDFKKANSIRKGLSDEKEGLLYNRINEDDFEDNSFHSDWDVDIKIRSDSELIGRIGDLMVSPKDMQQSHNIVEAKDIVSELLDRGLSQKEIIEKASSDLVDRGNNPEHVSELIKTTIKNRTQKELSTNEGEPTETVSEPISQGITESTSPILNETTTENTSTNKQGEQPSAKEVAPIEIVNEKGEAAAGGEPPKADKSTVVTHDDGTVELSHKGLQKVAEEFGLSDVKKRTRKSDEKLFEDADNTIKAWVEEGTYADNIKETTELAKKGKVSDEERVILEKHLSTLRAQARGMDRYSQEYDAKIKEIKEIKEAGEAARSEAGAQLRLPVQGGSHPLDNLDDALENAMVRKQEVNDTDKLTAAQKQQVEALVSEYKKTADSEVAKRQEIEKKYNDFLAEKEVEAAKKTSASTKTRKTKDDFSKERKAIVDDIREKLRKSRGQANDVVTALVDFAKIAPDVAKLVKSLVEEGVYKLEDVVKNAHEALVEVIPEITDRDVRDIIAGKYNEKKETRDDLTARLYELKREQKLLDKLEKVLAQEPNTESATRKNNRNISDLQREIAKIKKENKLDEFSDASKVKVAISLNETTTKKLEQRIENGDFAATEKRKSLFEDVEFQKNNPKLYNDYLDAISNKEEAKKKFDLAMLKDEMAKRKWNNKLGDILSKIKNTSQAIVAGVDDSLMFVQLGYTLLRNPTTAVNFKIVKVNGKDTLQVGGALKEHLFDAWSKRRFERQINALKTSPAYPMIKASGLKILEPTSLLDTHREEMFQHNFLDKLGTKDVNLGKLTSVFERAYTSLGNNTRVSLFLKEAAVMHEKGMTIENSLEEYKGLANAINNLTGQGSINATIAQGIPTLTTLSGTWSPKMLASSLNLLGLSEVMGKSGGFYTKLPPHARAYAAKQISGGLGIGIGIMAAAALGGYETHPDPRDVRFGDVEYDNGNKSFNVFGRFASVIKFVAHMMPWIGGVKKNGEVTSIYETGGKKGIEEVGGFFRGKMNPIYGLAYDYTLNDKQGYFDRKEITPKTAAGNLLVPMAFRNIGELVSKDGTMQLHEFLLNFTGISMKDQRDYFVNNLGDSDEGKWLKNNKVKLPDATNSIPKDEKHPTGKMNDDEFEKFNKKRDALVKDGIAIIMKKGWVDDKGKRVTPKDLESDNELMTDAIKELATRANDVAKEKVIGKKDQKADHKKDRANELRKRLLGRKFS
jgi:hypothetical protein